MSIIERLTEGMVQRDMKQEGQALLEKWTRTGLLEGLEGPQSQHNMARLLENQAKELLRESSTIGAGDVEGFAAVAFPIVRRVFAGLIANELVSVQPMSLPSGLIFFLDFTYGDSYGDGGAMLSRFGNKADLSIYGTDKVGSGVLSGVNIADSKGGDVSAGPRGMVGYAFGSPSGSSSSQASGLGNAAVVATINLDGDLTNTQKAILNYDPDLMSKTTGGVIVLDIIESAFDNPDFENLSAFSITDCANQANTTAFAADLNASANVTVTAITNISQVRRLTKRVSSDTRGAPYQSGITAQAAAVRLFIASDESQTESTSAVVVGATLPAGTVNYPVKDELAAGGSVGSVGSATNDFLLELNDSIPEIDIKVDSTAITAQTKKLKAKWTPELGQDLNAYHNLDAEVELTSILSEQIALEIDREILADLVNGATAGHSIGRALQVSLWIAQQAQRSVLRLLLLTSQEQLVNGMRLLLRQSMMFLLRFTARPFVAARTSLFVLPKLPTSLSSPLASVPT
jgi:hypothetical protein